MYYTVDIHHGNLVVSVYAKVRARYNIADFKEVKALQSNRYHALLVTIGITELVEAFTLLIDFNPSIVRHIAQNLIFCLKAELFTKLRTCSCTHDIVITLLSVRRLKRSLNIIEYTIAIKTDTLEVTVLIESYRHNLLTWAQLLYDFVVVSVKDLNVALVEGDHDVTIVAESVIGLKLTSLL